MSWTLDDHRMQAVLSGFRADLMQAASLLDGLARDNEVARLARERIDAVIREMQYVVPVRDVLRNRDGR